MRVFPAVILVVGISIGYTALTFLSGAFLATGHGTIFFFQAILSPFTLLLNMDGSASPWSILLFGFWPMVALSLAFRGYILCRTIAALAILAHYAGIILISMDTDWYYVAYALKSLSFIAVPFLGAYLASQFYMWSLIIRGDNQKRSAASA